MFWNPHFKKPTDSLKNRQVLLVLLRPTNWQGAGPTTKTTTTAYAVQDQPRGSDLLLSHFRDFEPIYSDNVVCMHVSV